MGRRRKRRNIGGGIRTEKAVENGLEGLKHYKELEKVGSLHKSD